MDSDPAESVPAPQDEDPTLGDDEFIAEVPAEDLSDAGDGAAAPENDLAPSFDIDDTIRVSRVVPVQDRSRLVISVEALIDWRSGTKVGVKLTSRTVRQNPGQQVYALSTSLRIVLITKKLGSTNPPMEVTPMEDDWPVYGFNLVSSNLNWAEYQPGSAWVHRANEIWLPYSGPHLVQGTGEPPDNPIRKITVWAIGGFAGLQQFHTDARSAIRGGA
jgi:hypothetical protein